MNGFKASCLPLAAVLGLALHWPAAFATGAHAGGHENGETSAIGAPGMAADENMVTLAPGKTGEVVWRFTKTGKVDFACLQPGHHDAGMKGQVVVAGHRVDARARHAQARTA